MPDTPARTPPPPVDAGSAVGRWTLESRLGAGAFGSVWQARDPSGMPAALKLIDCPPGDELRSLRGLVHPCIPAVLDAGNSPAPHLVMELAQGRPLDWMIRQGRAPEPALCRVLAALADALAAVHAAGIAHGDLKPANVVIGRIAKGEIKLVDFGMVGQAGGTLAYAAPERLSGGGPSAASDLYALALCAWEMGHGGLPHGALGLSAALQARRGPPPQTDRLSPWLAALLRALLDPDPARRPTASALVDALDANGFPPPALDRATLRRRADALRVPVAAVDAPLDAWLADGGALVLQGPPGSGRSQHAQRALTELVARGDAVLELRPTPSAWGAVEEALGCRVLPGAPVDLPDHPDAETRAVLAAELLLDRVDGPLWVVCDDADALSDPARRFRDALSTDARVAVLSTVAEGPAEGAVALPAFDADQTMSFVSGVLQGEAPDDLLEALDAACGGHPATLVDALAACIADEALVRRNGRWLADAGRLAALDQAGALSSSAPPDPPPPSVDPQLAALLALSTRPLTEADLVELNSAYLEAVREQLDALLRARLIEERSGGFRPVSRAAAEVLRGETEAAPLHQALALHLLEQGDDDGLAAHLAAAADADLAAAHGPSALRAALHADPLAAAGLAVDLHALAPTPAVTAVAVTALRKGGRATAARDLGEAWLGGRGLEVDHQEVWAALLRAHTELEPDSEAAAEALARGRALTNLDAPAAPVLLSACASLHLSRGELADGEAAARALVTRPAPDDDADLEPWLAAHSSLAQALQRQGRLDEAVALLEGLDPAVGVDLPTRPLMQATYGLMLWHAGRMREAAAAFAAAGDRTDCLGLRARARTLNNAATAWYQCGDRAQAVAHWERALLLFERLDSPVEQVRVQTNLCLGYSRLGRWKRAEQSGEWAVQAAHAHGLVEYEAMSAGNLGDLFAARAELETATRWYDRCDAVATAAGLEGERVELARRRLELAFQDAPADVTPQAVSEALALAEAAEATLEAARLKALLGVVYAHLGEPTPAHIALDEAESTLRDLGASGELAQVRIWAARAAALLGDPSAARAHLERVRAFVTEVGDVPLRDQVDALVEELEARRSALDSTASAAQQALVDLASEIASETDSDALLKRICLVALEATGGERAFVLGPYEGAGVLATARVAGAVEGAPSSSVVAKVRDTRRPVLVADLQEREDLRGARSVMALSLQSAMAAPLLHGETLLGVLYLDSPHTTEAELDRRARDLKALAGFAAVALDNAQRMQEAEERARQGRELAHDFRSPLASIVATLDMLEDEVVLQGPVREAVETIRRLTGRAHGLAEGFLQDRRRVPRPMDVGQVLSMAVADQAPAARRAGITLSVAAPDAVTLPGFPSALRRAVVNLIGNAVKYTPAGGAITVSLSIQGAAAVLRVDDTGPGLPEALLPTIFEAGAQAEGALPGYGIGLSVVQRVARELGGEAVARNRPEGGARFELRLPLAEAATASAAR